MPQSFLWICLAGFLSCAACQTLMPLTDDIRQALLDKHNSLRSIDGASATYMLKMQWDFELEADAGRWGMTCAMKHSTQGFPARVGMGENLWFGSWDISNAAQNAQFSFTFPDAIQDFYDEKTNYVWSTKSGKNGATVGHYTQVVQASTDRVACAIVTNCAGNANNGPGYASWIVCHYSTGNYALTNPYTNFNVQTVAAGLAKPCSQCPLGYGCCENNLCVGNAPVVPTTGTIAWDLTCKGPSNVKNYQLNTCSPWAGGLSKYVSFSLVTSGQSYRATLKMYNDAACTDCKMMGSSNLCNLKSLPIDGSCDSSTGTNMALTYSGATLMEAPSTFLQNGGDGSCAASTTRNCSTGFGGCSEICNTTTNTDYAYNQCSCTATDRGFGAACVTVTQCSMPTDAAAVGLSFPSQCKQPGVSILAAGLSGVNIVAPASGSAGSPSTGQSTGGSPSSNTGSNGSGADSGTGGTTPTGDTGTGDSSDIQGPAGGNTSSGTEGANPGSNNGGDTSGNTATSGDSPTTASDRGGSRPAAPAWIAATVILPLALIIVIVAISVWKWRQHTNEQATKPRHDGPGGSVAPPMNPVVSESISEEFATVDQQGHSVQPAQTNRPPTVWGKMGAVASSSWFAMTASIQSVAHRTRRSSTASSDVENAHPAQTQSASGPNASPVGPFSSVFFPQVTAANAAATAAPGAGNFDTPKKTKQRQLSVTSDGADTAATDSRRGSLGASTGGGGFFNMFRRTPASVEVTGPSASAI